MEKYIAIAKVIPMGHARLHHENEFMTPYLEQEAKSLNRAKIDVFTYLKSKYKGTVVTNVTVESDSNLNLLLNEAYYYINKKTNK